MELTDFLMYSMILAMFMMIMAMFLFVAYFAVGLLRLARGVKVFLAPLLAAGTTVVQYDNLSRRVAKPKENLTRNEVMKVRAMIEENYQ